MTIHAVIASEPHLPVNLFDGRKPDELIQVTMKNGTSAIGTYLHVGRMHFINTPDPNAPFGSRVIGPIKQQDIEGIVVLKDAAQIKLERFNRTRGDRLPGPEPKSREDFRFRLECLARAVIQEPASMRRYQLEKQFNDCADAINLAKAKRAWVFAETQWFLQHNRPPEMIDLWRSDIASPSLFKKPRDQDFDPDPVQRRKRVPYPADVSNDPLSVPNVLNKLKKLGCAAYISLAAEDVYKKAVICINFPDVPGRSKVNFTGTRIGNQTTWTVGFDCGCSRAGWRRESRIKKHELYERMIGVVRNGLVTIHQCA